ncbi:MBL fold metallo-hydrolase [Psychromonas antarctica]|uniref:MBL fold metallo-hydrolase n=1 Tax=Psychromonas antarctica TaxID=67573 RepID=UPI001EE8F880|nr:MBL fold metallo-hydrolase [Psychromonas antarctica]MCG6202303.1 MBL fold metallo-hydrolase [Psychromonas antarctica]
MMSHVKIFISITLVLAILIACSSNSSEYSKKISLDNKPQHHTSKGYQNHPVVETAAPKGIFFYMRRAWDSVFIPDVPDGHELTELESLQLLNSISSDRVTWLGHASFLITTSGVTILTDPFLSKRASPVSWAGPKRFVDFPIPINKLPSIDIVIISHNHYDHLDDKTVRKLENKHNIHVVVPLGLKSFFIERGYSKVTELDWGQSVSIEGIDITAEPSVHDSARSTSDHNETLWASWVIESFQKRILFIGDTGYSETIFNLVGDKYGSFDFAILPIGAYEPRELLWMSHTTPEEAVSIGIDVRAKTLIASHWGTISSLSDEPLFEPPIRFKKAGLDSEFSDKELWIMKVGETRSIAPTKSINVH